MGAMLAGLLVIIFVPEYRFDNNLKANREYYPEGVRVIPVAGTTQELVNTP